MNKGKKGYKEWAKESSEGDTYVYCKFCHDDVLVESCYGAHSHQTTRKHIDNEVEWRKNNPAEIEATMEIENRLLTINPLTKTQMFEFKLVKFIADNNCSMSLGDEFVDFLKVNVPDSQIIKDIKFYRKKTSLLLNEVIKPTIKENLEQKLSNRFFSLIIDEVSDKTKTKYLALMIQYWDFEQGQKCELHSLIDCSSAKDSEQLFQIIDDKLLQKSYGGRLVAFASDGASILRGKRKSVLKLLKDRFPHVWDVHCLSHSFNLISNYATKSLPDGIEYLTKLVYNHFAFSCPRVAEWLTLQAFMNIKAYKIVTWTEVRWSSLLAAVSRLLERWEALMFYFGRQQTEEDHKIILKELQKPEIKAYFQFLKIFLEKIDGLNKHFQQKLSQILTIEQVIKEFFTTTINILLKPDYKRLNFVQKLQLIKKDKRTKEILMDAQYLKSNQDLILYFEEVFEGAIDFRLIQDDEEKRRYIENIKKFLLRLLYKSSTTLPFGDKLLNEQISCLFPTLFNEQQFRSLAKQYTNIIPPNLFFKLNEELHIFEENLPSLKTLFEEYNQDITLFYCDEKVRVKYEYITLLSTTILSFPHSTCQLERLFSQLKLTKTEKRLNMSDSTLEGLLMLKEMELDLNSQDNALRLIKKYEDTKDKGPKESKAVKRSFSDTNLIAQNFQLEDQALYQQKEAKKVRENQIEEKEIEKDGKIFRIDFDKDL